MTRREISLLQWILLLPCLAFFFPILKGKVPFTGDILYSFHPWTTYVAQNLQAGHLPLWNPYSACGEPFLANPQTMIFYPGAVMFWVFPFASAWPLFTIAHQALLFWAAALLVKYWNRDAARGNGWSDGGVALAASAIAWGGFSVIHWEFFSAVATMPFIPLVLLFSLSGQWLSLSLAVALIWTGGYSQFAVYALMWGGMGMLWRTWETKKIRTPLLWISAVIAGVALAAPQILPSWEVTRQSMRAGIGAAESHAFLLTPIFFVKFLLPGIVDKISLPYMTTVFDHTLWPIQRAWLTTFFIGTAPLLLAAAGLKNFRTPRVIFPLVSIALFLCLAMGIEPVFTFLRRTMPGLRYMTHFSNALGIVLMAMALLIPEGTKISERRRVLIVLWSTAAAVALAVFFSAAARLWVIRHLMGMESMNASQHALVLSAARLSLAALALSAICFFLPGRWRAAGWIALTLAELWIFGGDIYSYTDPSFFHKPVPLASALVGTPNRLAYSIEMIRSAVPLTGGTLEEGYQSVRQILHPSLNLPHRVPFTWGYEVFPLKNFTEFRRTLKEGQEAGPQINFIGGRHVLAMHEMPFRLTAQRPNGLLYTNDDALPRVSWVATAKIIPDADERLRYISGAWKPEHEVILEEAPAGDTSRPDATPRTEGSHVWKELPGRMTARGEDARAGWLVYSDVFYPGWEAYMNGERVKLWKANHAFQAVHTPAGKWEAVLIYRPQLFLIGLMGSVVAGLLIGMSFLFLPFYRR